jgi:LuxR family maltose regulon positive regulatory protein
MYMTVRTAKIQTPSDMILRTKLIPPELKSKVIERDRLMQLLRDNEYKDIILIIADAGYGKTTLISQWVRASSYGNVFYALSEEDSNFDLFLNHLIAGFEQLEPDLLQRTKNLVLYNKEQKANISVVMGTLVNEIQEKARTSLYLILDDYHTIAASSIVHEALHYLIEHLPTRVHIIITSRISPRFSSLTKWRSKQRVLELKREDLVFTTDEVKELINNTYDLSLSSKELQRIEQYTEGWITGIQLILQSSGLHRMAIKDTLNGFLEAHEPLFEYFAHEVLSYEPQDIQEFLIQCSLLDTLTPEACDHVLRRTDSHRLLPELEHRHLFLTEVREKEYIFHHLFQKYLNQCLVDHEKCRRLHARAAQYYRKKKYLDLSIKHFLAAAHFLQAGRIMLRSIKEDTAGRISGGIDTTLLRKYLNEIPDDVLNKLPELLVIKGTLLRDAGAHEKAKELYSLAEKAARETNDMTTYAHSLSEKALLHWLQGKHSTALKLLQKALRTCPVSNKKMRLHVLNLLALVWQDLSDLSRAKTYLRKSRMLAQKLKIQYDQIILTSNLGTIYLQEGEIKRAYEICKPLIPQLGEQYYYKVGVIYANAARAALDYGDIAWAESCLQQGWNICRPYDDRVSSGTLNHCFGLLFMYKEQWNSAHKHFDEARNVFHMLHWRRMESSVLRNIGTLLRLQGNIQDSLKSIEQAEILLTDPVPQKTAHSAFLLADRALLEVDKGNYSRAQQTIARCLRKARSKHWRLGDMYSLFVKTLVAVHRNNENKAKILIHDILQITREYGYHGIFDLELRHQPNLVAFMKGIPVYHAYLKQHHISPQPPTIHVLFFGGLRLEHEDRKTIELNWPTEKTKSLFAFLLMNRAKQLTRSQVLDALWTGIGKKKAHENLRTTAYRMRKTLKNAPMSGIALDGIFTFEKGRYILRPNISIESDVEDFARNMKLADIGSTDKETRKTLEQAINMSRDPFLPDVYDQWVDTERALLREHRLNALRKIIIIEVRCKDHLACVEHCTQYLKLEPLCEEIVCIYMKSLKNLGRLSEIRKAYKTFEQTLQKELHSAPTPETQRCYYSLVT